MSVAANRLRLAARSADAVDAYRKSAALRPEFGEAYFSLANLKTFRFTQEDIDNALLVYTHQGIGSDSFQFTISDGDSVIGSFTFVIATF